MSQNGVKCGIVNLGKDPIVGLYAVPDLDLVRP